MNQEDDFYAKLKKHIEGITEISKSLQGLVAILASIIVTIFIFRADIIKTLNPDSKKETADSKKETADSLGLTNKVIQERKTERIKILKDETRVLDTLPLYLTNTSLKHKFDWLDIRATNLTKKTLTIRVNLIKTGGVAINPVIQEKMETISPEESDFSLLYRPDYTLLSKDATDQRSNSAGNITIQVSVEDKGAKEPIVYQKSQDIKVLKVNEFKWNIHTLRYGKIPERDLVASLAVWSTTKHEDLTEYFEELEKYAIEKSKRMNQEISIFWFEKLYDDLIYKRDIIANRSAFGETKTTIARPHEVLRRLEEKRGIDDLATGLAIGALGLELDEKFYIPVHMLVTLPPDSSNADYLIVWSPRPNVWEGFSIVYENNRLSFEENKEKCKEKIKEILSDQNVQDSLAQYGAYYKQSRTGLRLIALNFKKAKSLLDLKGLP